MANNTTATDPQSETPNGTDPQGETPNTSPTGETPGSDTTEPASTDLAKELESLKAALKKANSEAAANRIAAKELEKIKAEAETAKLTEAEKTQKQLAALQAERDQALQTAKETRVVSAIQLEAMQQGVNATLASKLIDRDAIEYDDAGNPTNLDTLLKSVIKTYQLPIAGKQQAPTSGGATNPSRSASGATVINEQFVREVLSGKLPHDTYSKLAPEQKAQFINVQHAMGRR